MKRASLLILILVTGFPLLATDTGRFYQTVREAFSDGNTALPEDQKLVDFVLSHFSELSLANKTRLCEALGTVLFDDPLEDRGSLDVLGSRLSAEGYHPYADKNVYYFPEGSGTKVRCEAIDFFPSGCPRSLVVSVQGLNDPSLKILVPHIPKRISLWLYKQDRVDLMKKNASNPDFWQTWDKAYWSNINRFEFHETGAVASIDAIPYSEIPASSEWGCTRSVVHAHTIKWNPWNQMYAMYPGEDETFVFPGGISVRAPRWLNWWEGVDYRRVYVGLSPGNPIDYTFREGPHVMVREVSKTGDVFKDWEKYIQDFEKDTPTQITGGVFLDAQGQVSFFW